MALLQTKTISKAENFSIQHTNGVDYVVFKSGSNNKARVSTINALRVVSGYSGASQNTEKVPLDILVANHHKISGYNLAHYNITKETEGFEEYYKFMEDQVKLLEELFNKRLENGMVEETDIPFLIKIGDELVVNTDCGIIGGVVSNLNFVNGYYSKYWSVGLLVVHNFAGSIKESAYTHKIPLWSGLKPVVNLGLFKKADYDTSDLNKRGKIFKDLVSKVTYAKYTGSIVRVSWTGETSYRADGRLMIDPLSFKTIESDQYQNQCRSSGLNFRNDYDDISDNDSENSTDIFELTPKDYWRVYPKTLAFSFRAKKWGNINIDSLSPIEWRENSFDLLVMNENEKSIVKSLVQNNNNSFSDIIDEKGGGTIFMLYGPPGQGKTLTAETVAELSHKPLYSVSVGELGTNPSELEEKLRVILDVATIWDAVLLLDEADIFLEARDTKDIVRNAMVGVFLRLLEYHQGILFLTTNRVKNIDHAFFSRISVPLNFPGSDFDKRYKIWKNLTSAAGIDKFLSEDDYKLLASKEVNGRQIKNSIRIGQTLANSENKDISIKNIIRVLEMGEKFKENFNTQEKV